MVMQNISRTSTATNIASQQRLAEKYGKKTV